MKHELQLLKDHNVCIERSTGKISIGRLVSINDDIVVLQTNRGKEFIAISHIVSFIEGDK